ncbi:MAG: DUF4860 domain-containing protein [Ruminiclostridium sp.]|nr:DUF4860 domain-containing protein [Ruminiclostridium sp.]
MENLKYRGTSRVLSTAASLILFLIFAVCMLVIIGAGAGIYSRINSGYEATYGSSAAIKYVSNKIRASDSCEIIENGSGIALTNGNVLCVIYSGSEGIYEKNSSSEHPASADGGELVLKADSMNVTEEGGLYEITVTCGGNTASVLVRRSDNSGNN